MMLKRTVLLDIHLVNILCEGCFMSRVPNFIIVGAAKSGITSLSAYLSKHESIEVVSNRLEFFWEYVNPSIGPMTLQDYLINYKD